MTVPEGYYPFPYSAAPLADDLRQGLWAPGIMGLLSTVSTIVLLGFILYRFSTWRRHYRTFVGYNQYVVLIMNLLIADFLQAVSFLFSFHWIRENAILAPTPSCFAQGFLLNVGDLSSGFFVMAIALHTFFTAVKGRRIAYNPFMFSIIGIWGFALVLSVVGPISHGQRYFVKAGAWCWASNDYEEDRLALHYIWVFIVQFGTILVYLAVLLHLKSAMKAIVPTVRDQSDTFHKVDRAARLMILYPFFYILLTLPLSAGRMWSMAHSSDSLPNAYQCVAGALISSSGFVDALLYTLTRQTLLNGGSTRPNNAVDKRTGDGKHSDKSTGNELTLTDFGPGGITQTRTVTVTGHMLQLHSDDEDEVDEQTRRDRKQGPYHNFERTGHSPTGSLDPIISTIGVAGASEKVADKVRFAQDVQVTATALDDPSDDDKSLDTAVDHASRNRADYRNFSRAT